MKQKVNSINKDLSELLQTGNIGFKKIGISTDWNINDGYEHLNSVLKFDEVIIGSGWSNLGAIRYIYTDFRNIPATPLLIISYRRYNTIKMGKIGYRGIKEEKIIVSMAGINELNNLTAERLGNLLQEVI